MPIIQLNNSVYNQLAVSTSCSSSNNNSNYNNPLRNITAKMFSLDNFDLEATMARHFYEGSQATNGSSSSSEFFFGDDDNSSESDEDDAYSSGFNSDQENNEKRWVLFMVLTGTWSLDVMSSFKFFFSVF